MLHWKKAMQTRQYGGGKNEYLLTPPLIPGETSRLTQRKFEYHRRNSSPQYRHNRGKEHKGKRIDGFRSPIRFLRGHSSGTGGQRSLVLLNYFGSMVVQICSRRGGRVGLKTNSYAKTEQAVAASRQEQLRKSRG